MESQPKNNLLTKTNSIKSEGAKLKEAWRNIAYSLINVLMYSFRYSLVHYLGIVKESSQFIISLLVSLSLASYGTIKIWFVSKDKLPPFSLKIYVPIFFRALTTIGYVTCSTLAYSSMSIDAVTAIIYLFPFISSTLSSVLFGESFSDDSKVKYAICIVGTVLICQPFKNSEENSILGYFGSLGALASTSLIPIFSKFRDKSVPKELFMVVSGIISIPLYSVWYNIDSNLGQYSVLSIVLLFFLCAATIIGCVMFEMSIIGCDLSIVLQFEYILLALTFLYNIFIFGNPFSWQKLTGASLIIGANMQNALKALIN